MEQALSITKDTIIAEIVDKYPETIEPLMEFGVHCVGCHVSPYETLEGGFKGHGMTDEQISEAVEKLNSVISNGKQEQKEEFDHSKSKLDITDKAAEKIKALIDQEKMEGLRIQVVPGGCSGFKYSMELDSKKNEDIVVEEKGIKVLLDRGTMEKLDGSVVDYVEALQGAGFKIENPNATKSCGCGDSFR